jgi:hypothetical protein
MSRHLRSPVQNATCDRGCGVGMILTSIGGPMMDSRTEDLAEDECFDLLKRNHYGCVAFVEGIELPPLIMPLNYLVDADTVVGLISQYLAQPLGESRSLSSESTVVPRKLGGGEAEMLRQCQSAAIGQLAGRSGTDTNNDLGRGF